MKIAIIGAGISGVSAAARLKELGHTPVLFERKDGLGGLIRCTREDGFLYHRVGGHVFNSKDEKVNKWFWSHFNREDDFIHAKRNAGIYLGGQIIGYPIENHLWQLPEEIAKKAIAEILTLSSSENAQRKKKNLGEFFLETFGETLYKQYFYPYNSKIWQMDITKIPLHWLGGKLPMPSSEQVITANILREEENNMIHAKFFYPKEGGSQFIINTLAKGIEMIEAGIENISICPMGVQVNNRIFDAAIYTGDLRELGGIISGEWRSRGLLDETSDLRSNPTSNMLCSCTSNEFSWIYLPEEAFKAHRIIMTGNFSQSNNPASINIDRTSCTVEFSGILSDEEMKKEASSLPFSLTPVSFNRENNAYVIQNESTRRLVDQIKTSVCEHRLFLTGRFAEWEYYNMDAAIKSALETCDQITQISK